MRRIAYLIRGMLLIGAACSARQVVPPTIPTPQAAPALDAFSSPEMDALAAKLFEKLKADKVTSVVVVGGGSRGVKVSELAVDIRDSLNDSLARQATGLHIASRAETAAELKRLRVSIGMLYTDTLAGWISKNAKADGLVTIALERIENGRAVISAAILDKRTKMIYDKKTKTEASSAKFEGQINLTDAQINSATRDYHAPMNTPAAVAEKGGASMPKCTYCPKPEYTEIGRRNRFVGTVYILVTALPDGTPDDILITSPIGYGLDGAAVDALLKWKFSPGLDKQGRPAAFQVPVEIMFELY
jgi:TonB family protein